MSRPPTDPGGRAAAIALAAAVSLVAAGGAHAQAPDGRSAQRAEPAAQTAAAPATEGEVRKVDKDAAKITIRHGPIANLGMPAMTMVFRASDPAMLDLVKAGDRVQFTAELIGGQYTVTRLRKAP